MIGLRAARNRVPAEAGTQTAVRRFPRVGEVIRMILGLGSYTAYREHMAQAHPEGEPMTEAEFFRERQQARYGGGQGRCC